MKRRISPEDQIRLQDGSSQLDIALRYHSQHPVTEIMVSREGEKPKTEYAGVGFISQAIPEAVRGEKLPPPDMFERPEILAVQGGNVYILSQEPIRRRG